MSRDWRIYLSDIERAAEKILRYTDGMTEEAFVNDERTYDAVLRNLEIIGEAAKQLPEHVRIQITEIEWRKIAGFRDMIANKLSPLLLAVQKWDARQ